MKNYIGQIERRITVRQFREWGIIGYDLDNAYPQRVLEQIAQAPTAMRCWQLRSKYIAGNGFSQDKLTDFIVNDQKLTLGKLYKRIAVDKALFTGFGIHINYNANFEISDVHYVKFEDIRQGDPDNSRMADKFAVYFDWGRKTWKNITTGKIEYIDRYNPDPEVIANQVIDAGGWDEYKGQLYYFNPEIDDYPLAIADSVTEDFETEAGIKILNNRQVNTGFMPSVIIAQKQRREVEDNEDETDDGTAYMPKKPSQDELDLARFQGAKNAQKILKIEYQDVDEKPEITAFPMQNNDKLFEVTEKAVESRIIKGFQVPRELINPEKSSGLTNGGEKKEAIREFNDITAPDRAEICEAFTEIFSHFHTPLPAELEVVEIPSEVAEDVIGQKAGTAVNQLLLSNLPKQNKVAALIFTYGFAQDEAEAMAPEDGSFEPQQIKTGGFPNE